MYEICRICPGDTKTKAVTCDGNEASRTPGGNDRRWGE